MPATSVPVSEFRPTSTADANADARTARGARDGRPGGDVPPCSGHGLSTLDDDALLAGIRLGSQSHFGELYNRYFRRIYTFCFSRVHNHADAEEIAQETFTAVFRSLDAYRGQSSLLSWIYGIARNTANNHLRRARALDRHLEQALAERAAAPGMSATRSQPDEEFELRRFTEEVCARLGGLSDWQVRIFEMRHLEDLTIAEICERTQRTSDAVRSSLYRVKRVFREAAGREGVRS